MTILSPLTRPKTKKNRQANRPVYSNTRMKDVQHHVWSKIFPHAVELKASCWRDGPTKRVKEWLEQNFDKEDYRFDTGSRYLYFRKETDRNLIVLAFDDVFSRENPLHRVRSQPKNYPRIP